MLKDATNPENLTNFFNVNPDSHARIKKAFREVGFYSPKLP